MHCRKRSSLFRQTPIDNYSIQPAMNQNYNIQWNLYKWGSMGRAKLELAPFPGYNLYYEVLIYYLIASLFGVLIN